MHPSDIEHPRLAEQQVKDQQEKQEFPDDLGAESVKHQDKQTTL